MKGFRVYGFRLKAHERRPHNIQAGPRVRALMLCVMIEDLGIRFNVVCCVRRFRV